MQKQNEQEKKELKSNCCNAEITTMGEVGGTCYYTCLKCKNPCDQKVVSQEGEWYCGECNETVDKGEHICPQDIEQIVEEFINAECCKVCQCENGKKIWCACHRKQLKDILDTYGKQQHDKGRMTKGSSFREGYDRGLVEGRFEAYKEQIHEHEKLIDGFSHPKDCEMCNPK